ncbi:unnamed protein product [Paramecium octaurelia]|uniref:Uncharacterized protein n=1 Tax=Paramecium octaurelia TaxID=43137 RepID=A0A8S1SUG4_PAROT|nr:unnamed protein product [Paramecium octaurelia]
MDLDFCAMLYKAWLQEHVIQSKMYFVCFLGYLNKKDFLEAFVVLILNLNKFQQNFDQNLDLQELIKWNMKILGKWLEDKNQCSFANGNNEQIGKQPVNYKFKKKQCRNYHKIGSYSYDLSSQQEYSKIEDKMKWVKTYLEKQFKQILVAFTLYWQMDIIRCQRIFKRLSRS